MKATVQTQAFLLWGLCFLSTPSTIPWEKMRERKLWVSKTICAAMSDHWQSSKQILQYFYSATKIHKHRKSNTVCFSSFSSQLENRVKTCTHACRLALKGGTSPSWAHVTPSQPPWVSVTALVAQTASHFQSKLQCPSAFLPEIPQSLGIQFSNNRPRDLHARRKNSQFWDNYLSLLPSESQGN